VSTHDYVVVGGGSAGCVVARRLLDGGATVALIEAGGHATNPAIHDPGRWPELSLSEVDWAHATEPQAACHGRRLYWPRGKVLGGSGALNGMVYIRGHRLDYDGWAYHGCPGWGWDDVLPVFRSLEDFDRGPDALHGAGGPLRIMTRYEPHPLLAALVAASVEAGVPFNEDHNGPTLDGVGYSQLTIRDGVRETAASGFLGPVADHPNLTLYAGTRALRLRFAGARCTGVELEDGAVEASAEVVLCAGTIESPKLLLLSGIGPAADLAALAIERRVDLPGVGANLHDHLLAPVIFASPRPIPPVLPGLSQHHAHLFWRSRPGLAVPDTQPLCFHMPMYDREWMDGPQDAYTIQGGLIRTLSRGSLRLRSADPTAPPLMDPRALTAGGDLDALAASVELAREIGRQPALAEWTADELYPGPQVRTREELRDYVRRVAVSYHHQVGTCRMGSDEDAVVDPELRVRGVDGLRVADASIMPFVTTGNTNAPALMIGARAAVMMLGSNTR
jgi:choline dehydrogenase-like flavoprotein